MFTCVSVSVTALLISSGGVTALAAMGVGHADEPKIDACSLLQSTDIEQALRLSVETPERNDPGYTPDQAYSSVCVWKIDNSAPASKDVEELEPDDEAPLGGRHFVILNAMLWPKGKGLASKFLDAFYVAAERGDIPHTPVRRQLGDDALSWGDGLAVRKGDVSFAVSVFVPGMGKDEAGRIEEILARKILLRIEDGALNTR